MISTMKLTMKYSVSEEQQAEGAIEAYIEQAGWILEKRVTKIIAPFQKETIVYFRSS